MKIVEISPRKSTASGRVNIYGIGDMHADLRQFDEDKFRRYTDIIAEDDEAVAIFVGDVLDGRTPGRKFFDPSNIRPDFLTHLTDYVNHGLEVLTDLFAPIVKAGVPLVIVKGNHDKYLEEIDFPAELTKQLGGNARYISAEGMIRVTAGRDKAKYTTVIHAAHGWGGGRKPGSKINNHVELFISVDADVIMLGHVHDGDIRVWPAYSVSRKGALQLTQRDRVAYRCPSFVRRAIEGTVHYSGEKSFPSGDERIMYISYDPQNGKARQYDTGL